MKRVFSGLMCGMLVAGAVWLHAQQPAAAKPPARKAKKVWTNEDFPDKTAKAEPPAKKEEAQEAPAKADEKPAPLPGENLAELELIAESMQREVDNLAAQHAALLEQVKALEEKRDASGSLQEQAALNGEIQEKNKEVVRVFDQMGMTRHKLRGIQRKKAALLPEPPPKDPGLRLPQPEQGEPKEATQPKPEPQLKPQP